MQCTDIYMDTKKNRGKHTVETEVEKEKRSKEDQ